MFTLARLLCHSWGHAIPPPKVNSSGSLENWQGLTNVAWGASVYYEATKVFDRTIRKPAGDMFYGGRPIMLGKFGVMDWRPGLDAHGAAESPAHHRYPVWYAVTCVARMSPLDVGPIKSFCFAASGGPAIGLT